MSTNMKSLLSTPASNIKAPVRFPAGNYVMTIVGYDMLPFHWKKSGTSGLAYVPTVRPISCVELDDDQNPELQKEQQELLDKFGDWLSKEFTFAYTNRDTSQKMAQVSQINFPIVETNDDGEPVGILDKHAWRFYLNDGGKESGFAADILGLSFPENTPLGDILEATIGKKFMLSFVYEPNPNDPTRPPNLNIDMVTQA